MFNMTAGLHVHGDFEADCTESEAGFCVSVGPKDAVGGSVNLFFDREADVERFLLQVADGLKRHKRAMQTKAMAVMPVTQEIDLS